MRVNFTKQEDDIILKHIMNNPTNLTSAMEKAKLEMPNRNLSGIRQRYYNHIRKNNPVITTGSNKGFSNNVKNHNRSKGVFKTNVELNPFHTLLGTVLNLNKDEKQLIITILTK